jgi:hypothetical protein
MKAALKNERSWLTMVETAMTWSGSVACRIPRTNPIARIASPLFMAFSKLDAFAAYLRKR